MTTKTRQFYRQVYADLYQFTVQRNEDYQERIILQLDSAQDCFSDQSLDAEFKRDMANQIAAIFLNNQISSKMKAAAMRCIVKAFNSNVDVANTEDIGINLIQYFIDHYAHDYFSTAAKVDAFQVINKILGKQVYCGFYSFLPHLLDYAENEDQDISDNAIQAFLTISEFPNVTINQFGQDGETAFIKKLCSFIKNNRENHRVHRFIDSLNHFFFLSQHLILFVADPDNFDFSVFLKSKDDAIVKSTIYFFLSLNPQPTFLESSELYKDIKINWRSPDSISYDDFKDTFQEVFNVICELYVSNTIYTHLYLLVFAIFIHPQKFDLKLPNSVILMMYHQIGNSELFDRFFLKILDSFFEVNKEEIITSHIYSRFKIKDDKFYATYFPPERISEINREYKPINSADELRNLTVFDFLSLFNKEEACFISQFTQETLISKIKTILQNVFRADHDQSIAQEIFDLFFRFLLDTPLPITFEDQYTGERAKDILDMQIFLDLKQYKLSKTLLEIQNKDMDLIPALMKCLNPQWMKSIDYSQFEAERPNIPALIFYSEEVMSSQNHYIFLEEFGEIYSPHTHLFHIIPHLFPDPKHEPTLRTFNYEESKFRIRRTQFCRNLDFWSNSAFVAAILDIMKFIYDNCKKLDINRTKFLEKVEYQLTFLYLTIGLHSPCAQIMVKYPFMFPFSTRIYLASLFTQEPYYAVETYQKRFLPSFEPKRNSRSRAIMKFVVDRNNLFNDGLLIFDHFAKYRLWLNVCFLNEEGIGRGPTKEFFKLFSREFTKKAYNLWRTDDSDNIYATHPQQLFPLATADDYIMRILGMFCAKSFEMNMTISIPFNPAFFDLACGREVQLDSVDCVLAKSLKKGFSSQGYDSMYFQICINGHNIDMVHNGSQIPVTEHNFCKYKEKLIDFICGRYVKPKIDKFVEGWSEVLNPDLLLMFTSKEMCDILYGSEKKITYHDLLNYTIVEGGYTKDSPEIHYLFEIISEFSIKQQELFIQFVTGYPRLPMGLDQLTPKLTIKKVSYSDIGDQHPYPSASTCFNHLELPQYSSKEVMKSILLEVIENLDKIHFVRT